MKPAKWFGERTALTVKKLLSVFMIAVCVMGTVFASAADQEVVFEDHEFKVTAPDGTLIMNRDTNKNAAVWLEAGIADSEDRLEMMEQMKEDQRRAIEALKQDMEKQITLRADEIRRQFMLKTPSAENQA